MVERQLCLCIMPRPVQNGWLAKISTNSFMDYEQIAFHASLSALFISALFISAFLVMDMGVMDLGARHFPRLCCTR